MTTGDLRLELRLRDGTPVVARPVRPQDREAVAEAYRRLSPEARYHRFWTRCGEVLGDRMLDRLLKVDPGNHEIWTVFDPSREFVPMGAASWWRDGRAPDEAEFSVTVLDADQERGIGTLLLALMWLTAFRAGISRLKGYAMTENRRAVRWMRNTGAEGTWEGRQIVFRWDLGDLDRLPATPAAADLAAWLATLAPKVLG
jgi:RimJ/RimL family protein N-acetyltransferase